MNSNLETACQVVHNTFGDPASVLRVSAAHRPASPADGEVLVRVTHSAIHRGDLHLVTGTYAGKRGQSTDGPRVPGLEAVGVVTEAASATLAASGLEIGARVAFFAPDAWQSWRVLPAAALVPVPAQIPDDIAAQMLINSITALHVLRQASAVHANVQTIIQTGAASAVSKLITHFALQRGISPIRLVRSEQSADVLRSVLPGGAVISISQPDWRDQVREHASGELALAFDCVSGDMIGELSDLMADSATIMSYGALDDSPAATAKLMNRGQRLQGVTVGHWFGAAAKQQHADIGQALEVARNHPELFGHADQFEVGDLSSAISAVTAPSKSGNVLIKF
ncbi:hypothetical protein AX768_30065 (plasmid) [Burkholderia sp. PAMC 28687]|uniref:Alcohol dehydrogenase n=1 Tax=Caballeronia sordidicola TaxID=196367 RepID=A0A242N7F9_CABSO|nr:MULTISPECIES: alcohol dehydrogenase catalytic domain-containing protein [Burkholderiaceae]AMM18500.1 hypothetical protein AX768_30065 [Burkholderia sp. PAMC 28687]OTP79344.1 Alcohol dehydrogenase [Caballeronia sordidicola]